DEEMKLIERRRAEIIARRFSIQQDLVYEHVHSARHLPDSSVGDWMFDTHTQLLIFAFVLKPTREIFPQPHHEHLLPYFRLMAEQQKKAIEEVAGNARSVERDIQSMLQLGMSPASIAAQVASRMKSPDSKLPGPKAINPDDLYR